jgi:signal transduction histidine kinase/CheY-like chemotaxis protein
MDRSGRAHLVEILVLAVVYVGAARLGLMLGAVNTFAAPVWPPAGISLAALVLRGGRLWPGIALGAFVANAWTGAPVLVAAGIAVGNTLEAVIGAYVMGRLGRFQQSLDRLRHVLALTAVAITTTMVSATVGVSSLLLGRLISSGAFAETWRVWWLGNAVGDLVIAALLLAWGGTRRFRVPELPRFTEAAAVAVAVMCAGLFIFGRSPTTAGSGFLQACLLVPLLACGALRFGIRGATATVFLVSVIAIWGTSLGRGPFVEETVSRSLLSLQAFMSIVAPTLLALGAVTAERAEALRLVEGALDEQKRARNRAELAEEALREADRRKNEFLGILSHELRNPLAPIRNALHLLDRVPGDSGEASRAKAVVKRQTDQLTRLVDDLLDVTRISKGKIQLHRSRVDVGDLVRQVVEDHEPNFASRAVALTLSIEAGAHWVDADPTRLAQIVGNLLQNAAKFSNAHGGVLVEVRQEGRSDVMVRVSDDGIGIAPEVLPHIFEPFTQADQSLQRGMGGLGLGLALAKGLVELHGGRIDARSLGIGRGADFTLALPRMSHAPVASAASPSRRPLARRRVLVIDDNLDAAETLRGVLEMNDQEVAVAHDGREGLAKARALNPDVVLCDIGLPGLSGYDVARQIRADPSLSPTLVALTGYALAEDQRRAFEAGFDHHLAKPFELRELERILAGSAGPGRRPPSREH